MRIRKPVLRAYRKIPKWIRFAIKLIAALVLAFLGDIALLYFLGTLTALNLIDWKTVFSFLAVEVLAAVIARIMGIGQESESEKQYRALRIAALSAELITKNSHLGILKVKTEETTPEYPESNYFVVNTTTGIGYWAFPYIYNLANQALIKVKEFTNESELKQHVEKEHFRIVPRYPMDNELDIQLNTKTGSQ